MSLFEGLDANTATAKDRLRVAFAVFVGKLIAEADGVIDVPEWELLDAVFPDQLLQHLGFLDGPGLLNEQYKAATVQAMRDLPGMLSQEEKLDLVTLFHQVMLADQKVEQSELLVVREAAESLGLNVSQLAEHLDKLRSR